MPEQPETPAQPETPEQPELPTQPETTPTVLVPDLIALSAVEARDTISRAQLGVSIRYEETADVPAGQVLSQRPEAGQSLARGGTVILVVARAPSAVGIAVPDVVGMTREEAERSLRAEGFQVRPTFSGGPLNDAGKVKGQSPDGGASADRGSWVEIVIVGGTGPERLPTGGEPSAPIRRDPGEKPSVPTGSGALDNAPTRGEGPVVRPPPTRSGGTTGGFVKIPDRESAPTNTVPAVQGQEVRSAIRGVLEAGLTPVIEILRSGQGAAGSVATQSPEAGATVRAADLVRLKVMMPVQSQERYTYVAPALGATLARTRGQLQAKGATVRVIELAVPGHPYAGTGRVAAQWPISNVPRSMAQEVTLWVIK